MGQGLPPVACLGGYLGTVVTRAYVPAEPAIRDTLARWTDGCSYGQAGDGALPQQFQPDDVRFSEELVRRFIGEYTKPGQTVLDPFAGFGTTARVAHAMGRKGIAVELLEDRADYIQSEVPAAGSFGATRVIFKRSFTDVSTSR